MSSKFVKITSILSLSVIFYYHVEAVFPLQRIAGEKAMEMESHSHGDGCCMGQEGGHDPATCVCRFGHSSSGMGVVRFNACSSSAQAAFPAVFKIQIYCPLSLMVGPNYFDNNEEVIFTKANLHQIFWAPPVYHPPELTL